MTLKKNVSVLVRVKNDNNNENLIQIKEFEG